jgi:hypothetical protein
MSQAQRCQCCGEPFVPRRQNPTQSYCSWAACQRVRKRDWQREKRAGFVYVGHLSGCQTPAGEVAERFDQRMDLRCQPSA